MDQDQIRQALSDIIEMLNNEMKREIPDDMTLEFQAECLQSLSKEIRFLNK